MAKCSARDRWWGVEIDIPPALDDFFGVTNNKQSARYFSDLAKVNVEDMINDDETVSSAEEEYEATRDPQWALFEIAMTIQKQIRTIRRLVRHQKTCVDKGNSRSGGANSPEAIATEVTQSRQKEGYKAAPGAPFPARSRGNTRKALFSRRQP